MEATVGSKKEQGCGICYTCKFWAGRDAEGVVLEEGTCERITDMEFGVEVLFTSEEPLEMEFAALITPATFGCTLWEE